MVKVKKEIRIGDELVVKEAFSTWSTRFEEGDVVKLEGVTQRGFDVIHIASGRRATEVNTTHFDLKQEFVDFKEVSNTKMPFKKGDVLIKNDVHSCDVRFVEDANETLILLVNGQGDKVYTKDSFDQLTKEYKILCKKENREDL